MSEVKLTRKADDIDASVIKRCGSKTLRATEIQRGGLLTRNKSRNDVWTHGRAAVYVRENQARPSLSSLIFFLSHVKKNLTMVNFIISTCAFLLWRLKSLNKCWIGFKEFKTASKLRNHQRHIWATILFFNFCMFFFLLWSRVSLFLIQKKVRDSELLMFSLCVQGWLVNDITLAKFNLLWHRARQL